MRELPAPEEDDHTLFACPLAEGRKQSGTSPFLLSHGRILVTGLLLSTVFGSTKNRRGRCNDIRTSASTSLVMLAEKSIVWRAVGQAEMICLSASANPSESILSAPSRMRTSNVSNPNEGEFRRWSVR